EDSECQFLTTQACKWIRGAGSGWFANVNFIKPHPPRICPAPFNDMYDPADMLPSNRHARELENEHSYLKTVRRTPALIDERDLRETRACYYGMISEIDACIGRLVDTLKEMGQWDNTLIVFTSDHGEYLGDHFFTDKAHFYDETMRVPLIIRDPAPEAGATRSQRLDSFVESIDIAPTVLEYLGEPIPDRFQGTSVLSQVRGTRERGGRDAIHFEYDFRGFFRDNSSVNPDECILWVLRDERYKYVQFGLESMPPLLFDLHKDPGEFHNLAADPNAAPIVADYAQKMLRWRMRNEDQRMEHWASRYR
ncbi:MAG: sulfatase-like hydrolase/transferase, partial [Candidatus Hydrogenedentes bacterium]|nr:sulfatase-like hydrolase/transferase [Candidatus Hydrogenedentota bacterium]